MVRVLHLSDSQPDFSSEHGLAALARAAGAGVSFASRTIGPGGDHRNALLAFVSLLRGNVLAATDVVHAWSRRALWAAVLAGACRIVFTPPQLLPRRSIRWLAIVMKRHDVHLICSSEAEQRSYVRHGIPTLRTAIIRPAIDIAPVKPNRNDELRAALGFAPNDYVLLAPGESTGHAGHREALWTAAILHVLDPRYRILIWGRGPKTPFCTRLAGKFRQPATLVVAEPTLGRSIDFEQLVSAADAVLFVPGGPTPILPIAMCMAAGLPIVATPSPWLGDLLQDGRNSMVVPRFSSPAVGQRVIELSGDAGLQRRMGEAARDDARELFQPGRHIEQYLDVYRAGRR